MGVSNSAKNAIFYSIGEIIPRVISFFLLPLYTRYLSTTDFGIISYTNTFVLFLYTIGTLSMNTYALRFFFLKDGEEQKDMLGTVTITIFIFNTFLVGLTYLFLPGIIDQYGIQVPWKPFFQLAIITNYLDSFSIVPFVIYRVKGAAKEYVLLGLSKTIFVTILTIYSVCILNGGLRAYYWSQVIVYIPFTFIYLLILGRHVNFKFKNGLLSEGLKFALPLIPSNIAYILLNASDRIILERNVDISDLGVYNMAVTLSLAMNVIIHGMSRSFEPILYSRFSESNYHELLLRVKNIYFIIVIVGALFVSMFAKEVFLFMTSEQFHEGYIYVPILISMVCIQSLNTFYSIILSGERRTAIQATSTMVGAGVSVFLNLSLIPYFGVFVAACTQVVSMLVMALIKVFNIEIGNMKIWRELLMVAFMILTSYIVYYAFPFVSFFALGIKFVLWICLAIFMARIYKFNIKEIAPLFGIKIGRLVK